MQKIIFFLYLLFLILFCFVSSVCTYIYIQKSGCLYSPQCMELSVECEILKTFQ